MQTKTKEQVIPKSLRIYFEKHPKTALAFSGGVDSSYLLYAAKMCGVDITAYYVNSQFQPAFELKDAQRLAQELQVELRVLDLNVLTNQTVIKNPSDRCYHCKRGIFDAIRKAVEKDGYQILMDGSNASDDATDRPGMKALAEMEVHSPLRLSGMTKKMIRESSRQAGLFTWDKPAYACLATRVPTATLLTEEVLQKVEKAENCLFDMGFRDFRVRVPGTMAKIQLPEEQFIAAVKVHTEIVEKLSFWFDDIVLDLKSR